MQKCRKKVKSCLKQVNSNKALAGKVLQSLFTAGVVCVCTFGGDNAAWAQDYNSQYGTDLGGEYENVSVTNESLDGNSNVTIGVSRSAGLTVTDKAVVKIVETGSSVRSSSICGIANDGSGTASLTLKDADIAIVGSKSSVIGFESTAGQHKNTVTGEMNISVSSAATAGTSSVPKVVAGIDVEGYYSKANKAANSLKAKNVKINLGLAAGDKATVNTTGVLTKGSYGNYIGTTEIENAEIVISGSNGQSNETVRGVWATQTDTGNKPSGADISSKQSYNKLTVVTGTYASDMTAYTPNAVQGGSGLYGIQADNYAVVSVKEDLLIDIDRQARKSGEENNGVTGIYGYEHGKIDFNRADITLHNDLDASVTGIEVTTNAAVTGKALQLTVSSDTGAALGLLAHKYIDDTEGKGRITLGETGGANLIKITAGGGNARAVVADAEGVITFKEQTELAAQSTDYTETVSALNGGKVVFEDTAVITATGTGYVYGVSTYFYDSSVTEDSSIDFQKGVYINAAGGTAISAAGNSDTSAEGIVTINQGSAAGANEVVIFGDIESDIKGVVNVNLNTAGSVFNGSTSLYDDGVIKLAVTDGAAWRLTGTSSVTDLKAAAGGKIDLSGDRGAFSTLAIQKLTGTGGSFIVDNDGTDSDKITVAASDKGIHGITINNISSLVGKELKPENTFITVTGDADFVGETTYGGGIYEYTPVLDSAVAGGQKNWYVRDLDSRVVGDALAVAGANAPLYYAWVNGNGNLHSRLGALHQNAEQGAWARIFGGKLDGNGFSDKYHTYQVGYDIKAGNWKVGAAYEYTQGNVKGSGSSGENKIGALSLYGTLQQNDGAAWDIILKHGRIYGDINTFIQYPDSGDYETDATSLSVEYNKRIVQKNGMFFEPQAQFTYGHINGNSYGTSKNIAVANEGIDSLVGRLGIAVGKQLEQGCIYTKVSVLHEFYGDGSVSMQDRNGAALSNDFDYGDTWLEVGIGGNITLGKNCELYGDVERSFGGDITKNWGANVGFRYSF